MDSNIPRLVVQEKIGGLELRPVYVNDTFYHDEAGKVMFTYVSGNDDLLLVFADNPKDIPIQYDTVVDVLKHSSWMEQNIADTELQELLTAIDNAGYIVNVNGSAEMQITLQDAGKQLLRLARNNTSWREEYLAALEYANSIEMLVSSMFKEVSYIKSTDERIGNVLVNIKKLTMLLNDKYRTLDKNHTYLNSSHEERNKELETLRDTFDKTITKLETEKLSQQIVFNAIMAPTGHDVESATIMFKDKVNNALYLTFLDDIEAKLRKGKTLKVIRTELESTEV